MSKMEPTDYSKILEDAEKQISGIKNEKLREIAFSQLISHLLSDSTPTKEEFEEKPKQSKHRKTKRQSTRTPKAKQEGPKAWIQELADEGFFKKPKSSAEIREELETRSHHLSATDLTFPLHSLCLEKVLRRKKITPENGGKATLHWVNW